MVDKERRSFLNIFLWGSGAVWLGSILFPVGTFLWPQQPEEATLTEILAGKIDDFELDSGKLVKFGSKPALVIRTADDEFIAFEGICTHLDCTVQYRKDMGLIWCACHNGKFDLKGKNVAGPPPKPLTPLNVLVKEDEVFISAT